LLIGYANPLVFSAFVSVVLFLALLEFGRMGLGDSYRAEQIVASLYGAGSVPLLVFGSSDLFAFLSVSLFLLLAILFLFRFKSIEQVHYHLGWLLFGLLYISLLLGHLIPLRLLDYGQEWIFLTLVVIMGCDSFAYFIGRKFGRRKLYEAVSPNKSIEGALGGLAGSVLAVLIAKYSFLPFLGLIDGLMIGLLLGTAGQLGDLFESLLKRACGVKDSGHIIPGHGGMLDRLDSLLFAFPLVFYIARYGYGG
jgi:phosphatidate cytidylyltransferase